MDYATSILRAQLNKDELWLLESKRFLQLSSTGSQRADALRRVRQALVRLDQVRRAIAKLGDSI